MVRLPAVENDVDRSLLGSASVCEGSRVFFCAVCSWKSPSLGSH
jgi:hypothetical protein